MARYHNLRTFLILAGIVLVGLLVIKALSIVAEMPLRIPVVDGIFDWLVTTIKRSTGS
jgi:hypothetical protein